MDYEKLTFVEAIEELAKMLGMEVPKSNEDIKLTKKQTSLKSLLNEVSEYFQSNLKSSEKTIGYLKNRGIDGKTAKDFCIGYSKDSWDDITKKFGSTEKNIDQLVEAGLIIKKDKGGYYDRFRIGLDGKDDLTESKRIHLFLFFCKKQKLQPIDPLNPEAIWTSQKNAIKCLTHPKDKSFLENLITNRNIKIN